MATLDFTAGGTTGIADDKVGKEVILERELDFSKAAYAGVAGSDIVQMLNLPIGFHAEKLTVLVKTAEGSAGTMNFGDEVDPNGWLDSVDVNAVGYTISSPVLTEGTPNVHTNAFVGTGGKRYAAADTLDMIPTIALDTAVIKVFLKGFMAV
jgi:hypothetical protein